MLAPSLQKLTGLTALDLSCNSFKIALNHSVCDLLADTLACMPALRRLDLSNNRLKGHLGCVLGKLAAPLHMLRVCACGLTMDDVVYIGSATQCRELREVDVSENVLTGRGGVLADSLGEEVRVMEAEDCDLQAPDIVALSRCLPHLPHLCFINLARNSDFTRSVFFDVTKYLLSARPLRTVRASYPVDCYVSGDEDEVDEERRAFVSALTDHISSLSIDYITASPPHFIFTF